MTAPAEYSDLAGLVLHDAPSPVDAHIPAPGGAVHAMTCHPITELGGISIRQLAAIAQKPDHILRQIVKGKCNRCGTEIEAMRLFLALTACDACVEKAQHDERIRVAKGRWEAICPPAFRDTDRTHPDFPRAQYATLKDYDGRQSLFLGGDTRRGKTRIALLMIKRCLLRQMTCGVIWPEELKQVRGFNINRGEWVAKWTAPQLVLLDDCLLTGAQDEKITDALKDLIDARMRQQHATIITSQIDAVDFKEQAQKFHNATANDLKRVDALLQRIKETFRVVVFTKPADGEAQF